VRQLRVAPPVWRPDAGSDAGVDPAVLAEAEIESHQSPPVPVEAGL
jgi:hypothetical protein